MAWGFYQVGQTNIQTRELTAEKRAARLSLVPLLQAEEDARYVEDRRRLVAEEARIMREVPGWVSGESVYNSGKWMPPAASKSFH